MAQTLHRIFVDVFSTGDRVRRSIANQAAHPEPVVFEDEFLSLLRRHELEYEQRFLLR